MDVDVERLCPRQRLSGNERPDLAYAKGKICYLIDYIYEVFPHYSHDYESIRTLRP